MLRSGRDCVPRFGKVEHDTVRRNVGDVRFDLAAAQVEVVWYRSQESPDQLCGLGRMIGPLLDRNDLPLGADGPQQGHGERP